MTAYTIAPSCSDNRTEVVPLREGFANLNFSGALRRLAVAEPVRFFARASNLGDVTDYPSCGYGVRVFSKRMIARLAALGGFAHEVYDVLLVDGRGRPLPKGSEDFAIFQALETLDVLDRRDAVFGTYPDGKIGPVRRLALLSPASGFPPVFRVKWSGNYGPILSEGAMAALDGLLGLRFIPVPVRRDDALIS